MGHAAPNGRMAAMTCSQPRRDCGEDMSLERTDHRHSAARADSHRPECLPQHCDGPHLGLLLSTPPLRPQEMNLSRPDDLNCMGNPSAFSKSNLAEARESDS
jgi:hypothetical protein